MYRYSAMAALRARPLEAMGGSVAMLRGLWSICWPASVHDEPVQGFIVSLMPIAVFGWIVFFSGVAQLAMAYFKEQHYWKRVLPVMMQLFTIGIILTGYLLYDFRDVATAFYISMWLCQAWIWGDFEYARKHFHA